MNFARDMFAAVFLGMWFGTALGNYLFGRVAFIEVAIAGVAMVGWHALNIVAILNERAA